MEKTVKVKVGLAQFNVDFASEYLPYSVGMLQAYAQKFAEVNNHFRFLPALYKREQDTQKIAKALAGSDIIAFSIYVWNTRYSLDIAEKIKNLNPGAKIIFGGPNVPDHSEKFLLENPSVDFTIAGEGELAFKHFLLSCLENNFSQTPSLRFIDKETKAFQKNPRAPRIQDPSEIPSPYLSGVFDELMRQYPDQTWNVLWESNRGCPFSCTYCDWGSATQARVNQFDFDRLMKELEWFQKNRIEYLMCADANFGILERDVAIAKKLARLKKESGYPAVFAATYTKNATERSYQIAKILMEAGLIRGYTVSTQSVDQNTLKNVRRDNISQKTFTTLQSRFNKDKLSTYTDLIIGLPGETYESFKRGISEVVRRGQYNKVYFFVASVLPNAQMADPNYQKEHGLETIWGPQKNLHETVRNNEREITEYQEQVIATKTLPRADWRKTLCFAYMASFIYFNKLLHIPITLLLKILNIDFEIFINAFLFEEDRPDFPFFSRINRFFKSHALSFQNGGTEYAKSDRWLNVWWQPDKMAFMEACAEIDPFTEESQKLLEKILKENFAESMLSDLYDAIRLNKAMLRSPFHGRPHTVTTQSNIYDYYRSILTQNEVPLEKGKFDYAIIHHDESWKDRDDWCKKVVWYGNKTSAYLSDCAHNETIHTPEDSFQEVLLKPYLYA